MPLPLSEVIVAGATGHIADHNLLHDTANRIEGIALNALEYNVRPANSGATNRVNLGTAIAAAVTSGRPLYIPAGNYTLTYDASNKNIPVGGKLHLIGAGRGLSTLTCNPTVMTFTDLAMLSTTAAGEIHISDLTVQGPTAGSGNDTFDENSAFLRKFTQGDLTLERLQVKGNLGSTFSHSHASDVTIRVTDCKMTNYAGAGSAFEGSKNQTKCIIIIDGCEVHDIESLGTSGAPEPDNVGFYIHPHFEVHCSNSVFRNIPRWGIYMNSGSPAGTANSKGVFVTNCSFIDAKAVQCTSNGPTLISNCIMHNSEIMMRSGNVTIDGIIATGSKCIISGGIGTATETYSLSNIHADLVDSSTVVIGLESLDACHHILRNIKIKNTAATPMGYGIYTSNSASLANHDWDGVEVTGSFTVPIKLNNFDKAKIRNLKINGINLTSGVGHMMIEGTIAGELELNDFHIRGTSTQRGLYLSSLATANKIIGKDWRFTGASTIPIDLNSAGQQRVERRRAVAPTAISSDATLNLYNGAERCSHDTFRISGSTVINTITPGPFSGKLTLIATGAWSTSAAGNIKAKVGTARTVDRAYTFYFNPDTALWYELDDIAGAGGGSAHDLRGSLHTDALKPSVALTETISRAYPTLSNNGVLASGRMHLTAIYLPTATTVTSITYLSSSTALGTGTNQWFALYDSGYNLLRQTTDDTSTAWGADAFKTLNLTSTFVTTYSGLHYLAVMVAATTPPSLASAGALGATEKIQGLTPKINGSWGSGYTTTAPATAFIDANASPVPYAYVS